MTFVFNGSGLGIGLTVARELVEAHGGTVVALSPGRDRGSTFVVSLPLLELATPMATTSSERRRPEQA